LTSTRTPNCASLAKIGSTCTNTIPPLSSGRGASASVDRRAGNFRSQRASAAAASGCSGRRSPNGADGGVQSDRHVGRRDARSTRCATGGMA
jgi:hypothetical protein